MMNLAKVIQPSRSGKTMMISINLRFTSLIKGLERKNYTYTPFMTHLTPTCCKVSVTHYSPPSSLSLLAYSKKKKRKKKGKPSYTTGNKMKIKT